MQCFFPKIINYNILNPFFVCICFPKTANSLPKGRQAFIFLHFLSTLFIHLDFMTIHATSGCKKKNGNPESVLLLALSGQVFLFFR
jgi:hypothetical protein